MAFDKEFLSKVCDIYECEQLVVSRDGTVAAVKPSGMHVIIPGFYFDTDTVSGATTQEVIATASKKKTTK